MAEEEIKMEEKKKAKAEPLEKAGTLELKTSVKSYQGGINAEKQKMGSSIRSLQNQFKAHSKDLYAAALKMKEEGITEMSGKIRDQIKENKGSLTRMRSGVNLFLSEINHVKRDFHAYVGAFWG